MAARPPQSAEKIVSNRLSLSSFTSQAASLSLGSGSSNSGGGRNGGKHAAASSSGSGGSEGFVVVPPHHLQQQDATLNDEEEGAMSVQASNSAAWFGALDGDSEFGDERSDEEEQEAQVGRWKATPSWPREAAEMVAVPDRRASMPPPLPAKSASRAEQVSVPASPAPFEQQQQQATRRTNGTLKLQRRPTGGGILSRLRRINKKEAKAAAGSPTFTTQTLRGGSMDLQAKRKDSSDTTTLPVPPPPAPTPAAGLAHNEAEAEASRLQSTSPEPLSMQAPEEMPLQFRDAPLEHMPYLIDEAGRPSHERIHSLQPSLVDDDSILERARGSDEEDEEEEEVGQAGGMGMVLDPTWLEGKVREKRRIDFGEEAEVGQSITASSSAATVAQSQGASAAQVVKHAREATAFADAHSRQPTEYADAVEPKLQSSGNTVTPAVAYAALTIAKQTGWQEEEDAATPKGNEAEASRASYFDVPSSNTALPSSTSAASIAASSSTDSAYSTPAHSRYSTVATTSNPLLIATANNALAQAAAAHTASTQQLSAATAPPVLLNLPPLPAQTWLLDSELSAQHLYVFLREMCARQLRWESARTWLLASMEAPSKPAALGRDDLAIFKRDPYDANLPLPLLPFTRFLLTRALLPCPLFAPTSHGAPDVQAWWRNGVVPILKKRQASSLSAAVDRQGEGDGTSFNSKSTLDVLHDSTTKLLVSYLTALVRGSLPGGKAEPIPYPLAQDGATAMPVDEYYAHRLAASKLKQGGFELDVVGLRARSANECEFVICIKRYGHPYSYVIRDENDFFEYARGLSAELGPRARVRPLPRSRGAAGDAGDGSVGTMAGSAVAALLGSAAGRRDSISSATSAVLTAPARPQAAEMSPSLSAGSTANAASRLRVYGAGTGDIPAPPQRPGLPRVQSSDSSSAAFSGAKGGQARVFGGTNSSQISLTASERGMPRGRSTVHLASPPLLQDPATPFAAPAGMASTRTVDSNTADSKRSRIFSSGSSKRAPSPAAPTLRYKGSNGSLKDKHQPASLDPSAHHEARRHELRNWLRDALSVRGAGHCSETRSFLATGAFGDREMRPGIKADIELRARIDEERGAEREAVAAGSAEEVLELHEELQELWRECVDQDGFAKAYAALRANSSFSALPLPYQRAVSWGNLQAARVLYGIFIGGSQSSKNLIRAQDLFNAVPWSALSLAVREPTGLMAQRVRTALVGEAFIDRLLAVLLEDGAGPGMRAELDELRKRFGSPVMRKLEGFVELPDAKKRLIRQAAQEADLPLVSTIARGSDVPRLAEQGIKRIVTATKAWQEFMRSGPTPAEIHIRIKASADVRLIADMQRALRLLSLLRDARLVREAIAESEIQSALSTLLDPLLHALRRVHRSTSLTNVVPDLKAFIGRVLDVLAGLRARVIEPWKCISTLATLLDDAVPAWYGFVHTVAGAETIVEQLFAWLQSLATLVSDGCGDVAAQWAPPRTASSGSPERRSSVISLNAAPLDIAARSSITDLTAAAYRQRAEDFKQACRWAAGDVDAAETIQVQGAAGKSRTERIYQHPPKPARPTPGLEKWRPSFRDAIARALR